MSSTADLSKLCRNFNNQLKEQLVEVNEKGTEKAKTIDKIDFSSKIIDIQRSIKATSYCLRTSVIATDEEKYLDLLKNSKCVNYGQFT